MQSVEYNQACYSTTAWYNSVFPKKIYALRKSVSIKLDEIFPGICTKIFLPIQETIYKTIWLMLKYKENLIKIYQFSHCLLFVNMTH